MTESKASRTLVKSPPELWSEVSSAASLQRHMDRFGEIRITKLEPETAVAWEGENARGTITLEASGWGTKVSLTAEIGGEGGGDAKVAAQVSARDAGVASEPEPDPSDRVDPEPAPTDRVDPEPAPTAGIDPEPAPTAGTDPQPAPSDRVDPEPAKETSIDLPPEVGKRRWTRRVALKFREWLRPRPMDDTGPPMAAPARPSEPDEPAVPAPARPSEPDEPVGAAAPVTPVTSGSEQPAASSPAAPVERAPEPEATLAPEPEGTPPPEIEPVPTAALDAALDSLGQAHHRPYSRA